MKGWSFKQAVAFVVVCVLVVCGAVWGMSWQFAGHREQGGCFWYNRLTKQTKLFPC